MDTTHLLPAERALRLLDLALALWVLAWIGMGVAIGLSVSDLKQLTHTLVAEGHAVQGVGASLHSLSGLPFVGGEIGSTAAQIQRAGASAVASGTSSSSSVQTLAVLLGVAVALLPSIPVLGFYLPLRLQRAREARALRRAVRAHGGDPEFTRFLARRAISGLGYERLVRATPTPWAELPDESCEQLAAAELGRLGIDPRLLHARRARA
jgi:hypothetical protein